MNINIKVLFLTVFLNIPVLLFSQDKEGLSILNREIKNKSDKFNTDISFQKTQQYFLNKNWDSTLVYSMKQLSITKNEELKNYCHYFRGYSFNEKKLFEEAQQEYTSITKNFYFYNNVRLFLGAIAIEKNEFKKALQYFKDFEGNNTPNLFGTKKSSTEHNIGICYLHLKKYDKAETFLLKSVNKLENEKDTILLISAYGNIATLYYDQYKDDFAIPYFQKS